MISLLASQIRQYKRDTLLAPLCTALEVLMELLIPFITAAIIDEGIEAGNLPQVLRYGAIMLLFAFCSLGCGVLAGRFSARAAAGFACNLRDAVFCKVQSFSFSNIDKFSTAGLVTRMTTDVTNLQNAFKAIEQFRALNNRLRESADKANTFANIAMPVNGNLGNISYVLCATVGAVLALGGYGGLTVGTLVSFLTLNKNATQPVSQISQQTNSIVMAMAGAARIFAMLDEQPETDEGYVTLVNAREKADGSLEECSERTGLWAWKHPHHDGTTTYTRLCGDITFHDVDFGYTEEKLVLHNIDLYATPGQKIAFVGSTGAGKTTITNLINRFYDIADGKIRYDGININKIKKADLRRSLGIVLQDTHLFTGTVLENIRYGRLDASDEECIAAAKLANADGFIRRLPDGYNTVLTGDGANLSQGQRQLLSIARAAVADPPVLILDEATSSIDTRTEALVQQGMDALMTGRTTFVIAHRLSTVQNSDCIMVLEQGRIIERGTHDQLIQQQGRYYQLYTGKKVG